jgi:hypothetical protein
MMKKTWVDDKRVDENRLSGNLCLETQNFSEKTGL